MKTPDILWCLWLICLEIIYVLLTIIFYSLDFVEKVLQFIDNLINTIWLSYVIRRLLNNSGNLSSINSWIFPEQVFNTEGSNYVLKK